VFDPQLLGDYTASNYKTGYFTNSNTFQGTYLCSWFMDSM